MDWALFENSQSTSQASTDILIGPLPVRLTSLHGNVPLTLPPNNPVTGRGKGVSVNPLGGAVPRDPLGCEAVASW